MNLDWYFQIAGFHKKNIKHVLFVCMGNSCRSPACEFEFKEKTHWWDSIKCFSRGTLQEAEDMPMASEMKKVIGDKTAGFLGDHRSRMITDSDVHKADLILSVDISTRERLKKMFPAASAKIFTLREFNHEGTGELDVSNPWLPPEKRPKIGTVQYHNYLQGYARTIELIRVEVRRLIDVLYSLNAANK